MKAPNIYKTKVIKEMMKLRFSKEYAIELIAKYSDEYEVNEDLLTAKEMALHLEEQYEQFGGCK